MIEIKTSDIKTLSQRIDQEHAALKKAQLNAIRTEGFSLRETMMAAIRMGKSAPGRELRELSIIARTLNRRSGIRRYLPLVRLANAVTYDVDTQAATMRVGFTRRSASWAVRAAERQQRGFTRPVTPEMRLMMLRRGVQRRFSRSVRGRRLGNPLLLRLTTRTLTTPPRPIVAPFWASEREKSIVRIRRNFRLISRGGVAPGGGLYSIQELAGW